MRITPEHYKVLKDLITPVIERIPVEVYREQNPSFSDKRVRWDYFHGTGRAGLDFLCDTLYKYMNDEHMDTALKSIVGV